MNENMLANVWPEWKIIDMIGSGSYGEVYEIMSDQDQIERKAALKVISIPPDKATIDAVHSEGLSDYETMQYFRDILDDFLAEIKMMYMFRDVTNIVHIDDYKVVEKKDAIGWDIFIRMELLTTLNDYICDKNLDETEIIKLGTDICSALEVCAASSVIHRDIKPGNILVNRFGEYKLADFGIAKKLVGMTSALSRKGTPNYMAPEVAKGGTYNETVDLYSLGIVLYQLLNKKRLPFQDTQRQLLSPNDRKTALQRRLNGEPLTPPCQASKALADVILKACAVNPEDRYQSAKEMKYALQLASAGDTVKLKKEPVETPVPQKPSEPAEIEVHTFGEKKKNWLLILLGAVVILVALFAMGRELLSKKTDKNVTVLESQEIVETIPETIDEEAAHAEVSNTGGIATQVPESKELFDEAEVQGVLSEIYDYMKDKNYEGLAIYENQTPVQNIEDIMETHGIKSKIFVNEDGTGAGIYFMGDSTYLFYGKYDGEERQSGVFFHADKNNYNYIKIAYGEKFENDHPQGKWTREVYVQHKPDEEPDYCVEGIVVDGYFDGEVQVRFEDAGVVYHGTVTVDHGKWEDQSGEYEKQNNNMRYNLADGCKLFAIGYAEDQSIGGWQMSEKSCAALPSYDTIPYKKWHK